MSFKQLKKASLTKIHTFKEKTSVVSPAIVNERLQKIEAQYDLLQFKIDHWCIWPLFRHDAALFLQNLSLTPSPGVPLKSRYATAARDLLRMTHLPRKRCVVKTYSSARLEQQSGLYKDIFFDDLLCHLDSHFKIESINSNDFLPRSKTALIPSDITTTALNMILPRLERWGGPNEIFKIADQLSQCLARETELKSFSYQRIVNRILCFYWAKKLYRKILKQIRPEYLLIADFGEMEIAAAAKELGIKVIEFQHGIMDRHTYGYSWSSYALPYKAAMPVPDRLFLYGEYWRDELHNGGFWKDELCPVGSLRLDAYRKIKNEIKGCEKKRHILLTTQGSNTENVIGFISEFNVLAKKRLEFRLFIKVHPLYERDKDRYRDAFQGEGDIQVLLGNEAPSTFELLTTSHLHVSVYSACHYEALALGVPTVILPFSGHEHVLHLHEAGHAFLAKTPQELLEILLEAKDQRVPEEVGEKYFKKDALENMKYELKLNGGSKRDYQSCSRCVLDTSASDIHFDAQGVCNYCHRYDEITRKLQFADKKKKKKLNQIISEIKKWGTGKKYDCIVGLSGGTDSTYLVYLAKNLGLRPLAVHFDNGWDSELAVRNIAYVTRKLNIDLYSYVINWEEFKDLQLAYLKASVVDIEVPTDQLIFASLYRVAHQKGIKYILFGNNHVTEFTMPTGWNHPAKFDFVNLKSIHKKYGTRKLKNFPRLGYFERYFYDKIVRIQRVDLLDFIAYDKNEAKRILIEKLGWRDYGYKHYESIFTRFYQGYILPRKFHIDKRKAHLSNLICSGQMTKKEALAELTKPPYPLEQQNSDKAYVIKKLGLSETEFESLMNLPVRSHDEFGRERDYFKYLRIFLRAFFKKPCS